MKIDEKLEMKNQRRHEPSIYTFDPESCEMLCNGYWFTLFVSGICFAWAMHHLSWLTGIGWFFLSNLIAVIAVRSELLVRHAFDLWIQSRNSNLFRYRPN